jgi:hypothetical protein
MPQVTASPQGGDDELRKQFDDDRRVVALKLTRGDLVLGDFERYEQRTPNDPDFKPFYVAVLSNIDVSGMVDPPEMEADDLGAIALFHAALWSKFKQTRPRKGERLAIKHLGKAVSDRSGREFVNYRLAIAGRDASEATETDVFGNTSKSGDFDDEPDF